MRHAAKAYLETQVTTTNRGQILVLLFDGAIKYLNQAKERMAAKDVAGKGNLISKAMDVINELDCSLNMEKGGDLSANLHQLYLFCIQRLFTANCRIDPKMVDEVIGILEGLREAYAQIIDQPEAVAACEQVDAAQQKSAGIVRQLGAPAPAAGSMGTAARARGAYGAAAAAGGAALQSAPTAPPDAAPAAPAEEPVLVQAAGTHAAAPAPSQAPGEEDYAGEDLLALEQEEQEAAPVVPPTAAPAPNRMQANALYARFANQG